MNNVLLRYIFFIHKKIVLMNMHGVIDNILLDMHERVL